MLFIQVLRVFNLELAALNLPSACPQKLFSSCSQEYQRFIPNSYVELPNLSGTESASILETRDTDKVMMKGMVLVSLMHIKDEVVLH